MTESEIMEIGYHVGQVIRFFNRKGYGFIRDLNDEKDYFVHNSDIMLKDNGYRKLYPGEYVSYNLGKKDDGRDKCIDVRGIMGGPLLTENENHTYRVYPKHNSRLHDEDTPRDDTPHDDTPRKDTPHDESSDSDSDHDPEPEPEVKEVINKEAPEGIEVAEFDGLNINEEMG